MRGYVKGCSIRKVRTGAVKVSSGPSFFPLPFAFPPPLPHLFSPPLFSLFLALLLHAEVKFKSVSRSSVGVTLYLFILLLGSFPTPQSFRLTPKLSGEYRVPICLLVHHKGVRACLFQLMTSQ